MTPRERLFRELTDLAVAGYRGEPSEARAVALRAFALDLTDRYIRHTCDRPHNCADLLPWLTRAARAFNRRRISPPYAPKELAALVKLIGRDIDSILAGGPWVRSVNLEVTP